MTDDEKLELYVRDLILDICEVLYRRGYESASLGAMMRLVGVGAEKASQYDDKHFAFDKEFENVLALRKVDQAVPKNATFH